MADNNQDLHLVIFKSSDIVIAFIQKEFLHNKWWLVSDFKKKPIDVKYCTRCYKGYW